MINKIDKNEIRKRKHLRVRKKVSGTPECPRLCVFRSNANIYAQIIDDDKGVTLCAYSSVAKDFEGSGELAVFGEDWGTRSGFFTVGASVYVTGKIKPRFQFNENGPKDLKITGVEYLQTIKDKAIDRITIQLTTDLLDDQIVAELREIIEENPGKTTLFFQLRDSLGKHHVLLKSKTCKVDIRHSLIDYIEGIEALDYKIN